VTIGSLFAGIGGLELGLERAGLGPVVWQVEIDPYCRSVLARHWPNAVRYPDVQRVGSANLSPVDIICGGFPCQDVSGAGKGAGLAVGTRSGLWYEYRRIVAELAPRVVVVENVASGKGRWLCEVRSDLHAIGYGTRAFGLAAADVGAPHLRRRIFVVGYRGSIGLEDHEQAGTAAGPACKPALAHRDGHGRVAPSRLHADGAQRHDAARRHRFPPLRGDVAGWADYVASGGPEPAIRRSANGIPSGLDGDAEPANLASAAERLTALGNAVVPQCAEVIGRMITGKP